MKKIISVLLTAVLAAALMLPAFAEKEPADNGGSFGAYKHVFIIGIDGAGRFIKDAETPNFDRIFKNGAVDYAARTEVPTDSGPNWGSVLTGVSYFKHLIHNGNSGETQRTSAAKHPTVFTYVRRAMPEAELASFVNWNNVNFGMIETDIGVTEKQNADEALTEDICAYFDEGNAPALFFVQLDDVDAAGHAHGSDAPEYFDAIKTADERLGKIYDAVERNGLMEDGLFIVTADHGHKSTGGHGRFSLRESTTTFAAAGKTVVPGGKLDKTTRIRDIAAAALYALGVERPKDMSARIPADLFTDVKGERRSFFRDMLDGIISPIMWVVVKLNPKNK